MPGRLVSIPSSIVVWVAVVLSIAVPVLAQGRGDYKDVREMPSDPVGKRVQELLAAFNGNDPEKVKSFFAESTAPPFRDFVPMEDHQRFFGTAYARSKGFEFYGIREYENGGNAHETVIIVRNKLTGGWHALLITIDPEPPHLITGLNIAPARPPADLPPAKKLTDPEMVEELRTYVQKLADSEVFSGAVLLARDGKVLFSGAWGPASREFNAPNRTDTKFNLGSMNKMFTAVAVAQLVEKGKLSFDDPISKYLSEDWLPREVTDKVTLHHLLSHTSGLGSYFNEKFMKSSRDLYRKIDDYKPLIVDERLAFEPGSNWAYSNTGFLLAGAIIEKATGQSYFDYVRENIYKPAGMVNTDCYELDQIPANLAIGYSKEAGKDGIQWINNLFKHVIKGGPAGGGFSTVEDLLRFDAALRSGKLLSRQTCEALWKARPEQHSPTYGYGFVLSGTPGNRAVGHGGGFPGISSNLEMYLDTGYTFAVMSNYDMGAQPVNQKVREWLSSR